MCFLEGDCRERGMEGERERERERLLFTIC